MPDENSKFVAEDLLFSSLELLQQIVKEAYKIAEPGPIETGFAYRHANNIAWLAEDAIWLISQGHVAAPPIIARSMLESLFCLTASKAIANFPARKSVWELRDWIKRVRALNLDADPGFSELFSKANALIDRLETQYNLQHNEPAWSIRRCAEESGQLDTYTKHYFLLSQHTHSFSSGILARHAGSGSKLLEQTIIYTLLVAAGSAAELLQNATPQKYIDRATSRMADLIEMIEAGKFDVRRDTEAT